MNKINVMTSEVYNKIAAGEVVERAASVVKELVENSIDAGATYITVEIVDGGLQMITVADNGCGIDSADIKTAFLPHATSKIVNDSDLFAIKTMGFRGEALTSIAAVSIVEMTSKTAEATLGSLIKISGGSVEQLLEIECNKGTTIKVSDLFFNTPARKKFLKKASSETLQVTNIVSRLILANPHVSIKYTADGKNIYISQGKGIESAILAVYGNDYITNSINISNYYKNNKLNGYISKVNFSKSNTSYQTLIINNRYVVNDTVSASVRAAYQPFLMTRNYPFYVLYLTLPIDEIDVNVHPNKLDVRFVDTQSIFSTFYSPIRNALDSNSRQNISSMISSTYKTTQQGCDRDSAVKIATQSINDESINKLSPNNTDEIASNVKGLLTKLDDLKPIDFYSKQTNFTPSTLRQPLIDQLPDDTMPNRRDNFAPNTSLQLKYIGNIFDTYLVLQDSNTAYFVDQHAAHERILYDKYVEQYKKNSLVVQDLMFPFTFSLNSVETAYLRDNLNEINKYGFEIKHFGDSTFIVGAIPSVLSEINFTKFVDLLLSDLQSGTNLSKFNFDNLAQSACKAAVKAGDKLNQQDINCLIQMLNSDINLRCPHGRPIVLSLSKYEIEKMFKRIV